MTVRRRLGVGVGGCCSLSNYPSCYFATSRRRTGNLVALVSVVAAAAVLLLLLGGGGLRLHRPRPRNSSPLSLNAQSLPSSFPELRARVRGEEWPPPSGAAAASPWSPEFEALLHAYTQAVAVPPAGSVNSYSTSSFGCRRGGGGMADQLKGALTALLFAILSSPPRAFFVDWQRPPGICDALAPLTDVWQPAADGPDWRPPRAWAAAAAAAELASRDADPQEVADAVGTADARATAAQFSIVKVANAEADTYAAALAAAASAAALHTVFETNLMYWPKAFVEAARQSGSALNAAWWQPPQGANASTRCRRLPPELRLLEAGCGEPYDGISDMPFGLLDWWAEPTPALAARVLSLAGVAVSGGSDTSGDGASSGGASGARLLVGLHVRVGSAAPGAAYADQPRDADVAGAVALAAACALQAGVALQVREREVSGNAAAGGGVGSLPPPPPLIWYVASDSWQARDGIRAAGAAARAAGVAGAPAVVLDSPDRQVVHTDRSAAGDMPPAELAAAFATVYAEHALLSAAHALVRSRSGFSASAQAWGRVPHAFVLDVPRGECVDVSASAYG